MRIRIRKLEEKDISIYQMCYANQEFKYCIFGHKDMDINNTFGKLIESTRNNGENYIILYSTSGNKCSFDVMGFCNFLKSDHYPFECSDEIYAFNGGILPLLFNTGYGLYACASMMYLFFQRHPDSLLYASTFNHNNRSTRMLMSLGFNRFPQMWYEKNHFILDNNCFKENDFVQKILSRIDIEVCEMYER